MQFDDFLPNLELGRDVLDYEIWRLREGACPDFKALMFQTPFKAGLLVSAGVASEAKTLANLLAASRQHPDSGDFSEAELEKRVREAFRLGLAQCQLDVFHIARTDRAENNPAPRAEDE